MAELTPMMRQYYEMKAKNPGCLLFFRLGDFYEMFQEDAKIASRELDLTLTTRDRSKDKPDEERTPMCGVPYHSAEAYIARLVAKGYKIAICEQMEDPATAKGLVKRDIIRVVTPGTVTESSMLDATRNNFLASVCPNGGQYGLCFCDVSTGQFSATLAENWEKALDELTRFQPSEMVFDNLDQIEEAMKQALNRGAVRRCTADALDAEYFEPEAARELAQAQFGTLREDINPLVIRAAGALLRILKERQKADLSHIRTLDYYATGRYMDLDSSAQRNLELTQTLRSGEKRGSLLWVLDNAKTPMGSRMVRAWLEKPLLNPRQIEKRQEAVAELVDNTVGREELILLLKDVSDLERVMARIVTGTCNCKDLRQLSAGAANLPQVKAALGTYKSGLMQVLTEQLDDLSDLRAEIDRSIVDDPPFSVREGGMIRPGCNEEIDRLRQIMTGGKDMLAEIEAREKEKTGIKNMKVGYNRVFGYYIEVAKGQIGLVPQDWIRKQTLTNGERYITPELKELESTILTARDRVVALEYEVFSKLREYLASQSARVQAAASAVACADVLCGFAANAVKYHYCRPVVDMSGSLEIEQGRHPVVERMLQGQLFVPNDTKLTMDGCRVAIITGPNMAGKSTYMRQVALIVLMAQMGSFVPAQSAHIGVVDRLFTRIGASDDLAAGQSTFMVEMQEVSDILRHATPRSLLILDEIGRGTSTYDGMAIARAVLEFVADHKTLGAKTLFATHYHELTVLDQELPGVKNFNISVKKRNGDMIFLRRIVPGAADRSYGVEVAKLAGLPEKVVSRAKTLLKELEAGGAQMAAAAPAPETDQIAMLDPTTQDVIAALEKLTPETLTPIEAMNKLYELKQMLNH